MVDSAVTPDGSFTCYSDGRIKSNKTGRFVGSKNTEGYVQICHPNGVKLYAHRVIAWAFLGLDIDSKLTVDHLNGVKDDNRVVNLEIVTRSENIRRASLVYTHSREDIVKALENGGSWVAAAKLLGYKTNSSLYQYCQSTLGIDPKELAKEAGMVNKKEVVAHIRSIPLEELEDLLKVHGSQTKLARFFGVNQSTISTIFKEKRC